MHGVKTRSFLFLALWACLLLCAHSFRPAPSQLHLDQRLSHQYHISPCLTPIQIRRALSSNKCLLCFSLASKSEPAHKFALHAQRDTRATIRSRPPRSAQTHTSMRMSLSGGGSLDTIGLASALLSPAAGALGMLMWEGRWKGSVFALNLYKSALASLIFLSVLVTSGRVPAMGLRSAGPLYLSGIVGIVMGDLVWLSSLKILGTHRVLLVDCLRPALATLVGIITLGESVTIKKALGILCAVVGVYWAGNSGSAAATPSGDQVALLEEDGATKFAGDRGGGELLWGYVLALTHLLLDTAGSFLTKRHHGTLGPLQVNFLRFGSASLVLLLLKLLVLVSSHLRASQTPEWSNFPSKHQMTARDWRLTAAGVLFVTNVAPALFVLSLIKLPLGLASTLNCLGPVYEPPLALLLVGGRNIQYNSLAGALVALMGVALLCL